MSRYERTVISLLAKGNISLKELLTINSKAWETLKYEHLEAYLELMRELEAYQ